MHAATKSLLMLLSMLLLGVVLGAASMAVFRTGAPPPPPGEGPGGFVAHMLETIQPRDEVQRAAILPYLEATDQRNRELVDGSRRAMRERLDSMAGELTSLLDAEQRRRLQALVRDLDRPPPPRGRPPPR